MWQLGLELKLPNFRGQKLTIISWTSTKSPPNSSSVEDTQKSKQAIVTVLKMFNRKKGQITWAITRRWLLKWIFKTERWKKNCTQGPERKGILYRGGTACAKLQQHGSIWNIGSCKLFCVAEGWVGKREQKRWE